MAYPADPLKIVISRAFNLRLPPELRKRLDESAAENSRSLNSEIIQRLRASFDGYRQDFRGS